MKSRFTSGDLKKLAMGTMAADHAAVLMARLWQSPAAYVKGIWTAMRLVGRVAFPLYAFMIAEGYFHTKDKGRYGRRLLILALLSEIPYNLLAGGSFFYPAEQNTVWTHLLGFLAVCVFSLFEKGFLIFPGSALNGALASGFLIAAAAFAQTDYGGAGVLLILVFYVFKSRPEQRMTAAMACLLLADGVTYGVAAWAALYFINRYTGERGKEPGRLFSYSFYPVHMLILYGIGVMLHAAFV